MTNHFKLPESTNTPGKWSGPVPKSSDILFVRNRFDRLAYSGFDVLAGFLLGLIAGMLIVLVVAL